MISTKTSINHRHRPIDQKIKVTKGCYTIAAAAELTGLSTHAFNGAGRRGEVKLFCIGDKHFVTGIELKKFIISRETA